MKNRILKDLELFLLGMDIPINIYFIYRSYNDNVYTYNGILIFIIIIIPFIMNILDRNIDKE